MTQNVPAVIVSEDSTRIEDGNIVQPVKIHPNFL